MDIQTLKHRTKFKLPIYLGEEIITVIEVYEVFNLIEVKLNGEDETFVVDIITLKEESYNDKGIPLNLIKKEKNYYVK
ncbi:TPA: hypothetical protein ACSVPQ_002458 [Clostridioides difficile]|uniref:hypothetical protein n=1 Tax=Clostridioides TaxID=1870884 RepID=UPI00016C6457|nr:hypothetical protein [Clostridioides difficile]MCC0670432.1 hypothetical protein [Clostridioides sp. ES-S-0145-01]MCC0709287.1 hypothetical protein [Clostridioides sp. ES-S-0190-01]UDN64005.1 hypothetical protein IC758_20645 [Clostridioides sp. ES-W-0016-02]EGT3640914.1 hypothetical protein [Clostridioides difficile]EGT3944104.1 hypothetical protein [Clostridioides difficile]